MFRESDSDWNDDPGLRGFRSFRSNDADVKGFHKPTISSKLKANPNPIQAKDQLNTSNSAIASRYKQAKPGQIGDKRPAKDILFKKKHLLTKYRLAKKFNAPKEGQQNPSGEKTRPSNVRFAKVSESSKVRQPCFNLRSKSPVLENQIRAKNSKSLPRHLKLGTNFSNAQSAGSKHTPSEKKFVRKDKKAQSKIDISFSLRKKEATRIKKPFLTKVHDRHWDSPVPSSDRSKRLGAKFVDSSDREMVSYVGSEKEQFSDEVSSKYELSSTSKSNFRSNDLSPDETIPSFKDKDPGDAVPVKGKHPSESKSKLPFHKVFISRSKLNAKKQGDKSGEELSKQHSGKQSSKAVEEWLSNHCLPLGGSIKESYTSKSKIAKLPSTHKPISSKPKLSETDEKEIVEPSNANVEDKPASDKIVEHVQDVNTGYENSKKVDSEMPVTQSKSSSSGDNAEEPASLNEQIAADETKDVLREETETKSANGAESYEAQNIRDADATSQMQEKCVQSSPVIDEDWTLQLDKKVTFSEMRSKIQPMSLQNSIHSRNRILKDVSSSMEDFQGKSITFSVVDFNSEGKKVSVSEKSRRPGDTPINLSRVSIREASKSTSSSFVKKFNDAIEHSYEEKENEQGQAKFAALKRKEHLIYDPEMLKCSPSSSQWSYAVDLVNSVLKQNFKSEESHRILPSCTSNACNRDCILGQFHSNRITFSMFPGASKSQVSNPCTESASNEFSIWKNNNNTHNETKPNNDYMLLREAKTWKECESDKLGSNRQKPETFSPCQKHQWLGKFKELAFRNNNFRKSNSASRTEYRGISSASYGCFSHLTKDNFVPSVQEVASMPPVEQDYHTVYPLPVRIVESMHGECKNCINACDEHVSEFNPPLYQFTTDNNWTTVPPLDVGMKWDQKAPFNYRPQGAQNIPRNVAIMEGVNPYCPGAMNHVRSERHSANNKRKQTSSHRKKPKRVNRIRFSVMGNLKQRQQVVKRLNFGAPDFFGEPWSSDIETETENERSKQQNYDRLKIEYASNSSSMSSISNHSRDVRYGSHNLESNVIGTLPSRTNNSLSRLPISNVKPGPSTVTLVTLKSGGSTCSDSSNRRGTRSGSYEHGSGKTSGNPVRNHNNVHEDFLCLTQNSSRFKVVSPSQLV